MENSWENTENKLLDMYLSNKLINPLTYSPEAFLDGCKNGSIA